jgi:hypothetical protein
VGILEVVGEYIKKDYTAFFVKKFSRYTLWKVCENMDYLSFCIKNTGIPVFLIQIISSNFVSVIF